MIEYSFVSLKLRQHRSLTVCSRRNQPAEVGPGSLLDTLVTSLSREMVDDYPASDPRWAESLPSGTSYSLLIQY